MGEKPRSSYRHFKQWKTPIMKNIQIPQRRENEIKQKSKWVSPIPNKNIFLSFYLEQTYTITLGKELISSMKREWNHEKSKWVWRKNKFSLHFFFFWANLGITLGKGIYAALVTSDTQKHEISKFRWILHKGSHKNKLIIIKKCLNWMA